MHNLTNWTKKNTDHLFFMWYEMKINENLQLGYLGDWYFVLLIKVRIFADGLNKTELVRVCGEGLIQDKIWLMAPKHIRLVHLS